MAWMCLVGGSQIFVQALLIFITIGWVFTAPSPDSKMTILGDIFKHENCSFPPKDVATSKDLDMCKIPYNTTSFSLFMNSTSVDHAKLGMCMTVLHFANELCKQSGPLITPEHRPDKNVCLKLENSIGGSSPEVQANVPPFLKIFSGHVACGYYCGAEDDDDVPADRKTLCWLALIGVKQMEARVRPRGVANELGTNSPDAKFLFMETSLPKTNPNKSGTGLQKPAESPLFKDPASDTHKVGPSSTVVDNIHQRPSGVQKTFTVVEDSLNTAASTMYSEGTFFTDTTPRQKQKMPTGNDELAISDQLGTEQEIKNKTPQNTEINVGSDVNKKLGELKPNTEVISTTIAETTTNAITSKDTSQSIVNDDKSTLKLQADQVKPNTISSQFVQKTPTTIKSQLDHETPDKFQTNQNTPNTVKSQSDQENPSTADNGPMKEDSEELDGPKEGSQFTDDSYGSDIAPPLNEKAKTFPAANNDIVLGPRYPEYTDSHFFTYFLTVVVLCIILYLVFHNKQKIIALIIEGRHERRRRPNTSSYKKLDSNLEEIMGSSNTSNVTTTHVIY